MSENLRKPLENLYLPIANWVRKLPILEEDLYRLALLLEILVYVPSIVHLRSLSTFL